VAYRAKPKARGVDSIHLQPYILEDKKIMEITFMYFLYYKKQHFINLFKDYTDLTFGPAFHFKRLSSKAALISTGSSVYIFYINTLVFKLSNKQITLTNDGWQTVTTKKWINHGFAITNAPYYLFQKDFKWYIRTKKKNIEYYNDMTLNK